jgi:hypothetical protein
MEEVRLVKASIEFTGVEQSILKALAGEIDRILGQSAGSIEKRIRELLHQSIRNSPTYQSLVGGILQHELGIVDIKEKVERIIDVWINSIKVDVNPTKTSNDSFKASISIQMVDGTFQDVLSIPEARYITEKGVSIPWLEWLLLYGNKIIVRDYFFTSNIRAGSRTGYGVMKSKKGGNWRIPPEHAGTVNNNFITKVLEDVGNQIDDLVDEEINRNVK